MPFWEGRRVTRVALVGRASTRYARLALTGLVRTVAAASVLFGCKTADRPLSPGTEQLARQMQSGRIGPDEFAYGIVYRLYAPAACAPPRRCPLIVFLHGTGANGTDNLGQLNEELSVLVARAQEIEPTFVLAPQCPEGHKWVSGGLSTPHLNYRQDVRLQSDASKLVLRLLEDLPKRWPIDPQRLTVTGFSAGGTGTWDIVSRPQRTLFAAAAPMSGANDPSRAASIVDLPIWAFHGALDRTSPASNSREMVQELRKLGSKVRYTEYPDVGHNVWVKGYREPELVPWLLAQRRADAP